MTDSRSKRATAIRMVLPFVFRHWLDLLNDTILMALLPSLAVLLGSMILLGLHWSSLGLVIAVGALAYVSMTVIFSTRYIAPAATEFGSISAVG